MTTEIKGGLIKAPELAKLLGVTDRTVRNWSTTKLAPFVVGRSTSGKVAYYSIPKLIEAGWLREGDA